MPLRPEEPQMASAAGAAVAGPETDYLDTPVYRLVRSAFRSCETAHGFDRNARRRKQIIDVPAEALRTRKMSRDPSVEGAPGAPRIHILARRKGEGPEATDAHSLVALDADEQLVGDGLPLPVTAPASFAHHRVRRRPARGRSLTARRRTRDRPRKDSSAARHRTSRSDHARE